jgi:hypothetical protein
VEITSDADQSKFIAFDYFIEQRNKHALHNRGLRAEWNQFCGVCIINVLSDHALT